MLKRFQTSATVRLRSSFFFGGGGVSRSSVGTCSPTFRGNISVPFSKVNDNVPYYVIGQSVSDTGRPGQKLWKIDFIPSVTIFVTIPYH